METSISGIISSIRLRRMAKHVVAEGQELFEKSPVKMTTICQCIACSTEQFSSLWMEEADALHINSDGDYLSVPEDDMRHILKFCTEL